MSRTALLLVAAAGLCGAMSVHASTAPAPARGMATQAPSTPAQPTPETAALYKLHCQVCHGANGKAPLPEMAFFEREWKHGTASEQMARVIAEGVTGTPMMPFKGKLTPDQITALARLVRSFDPTLKPEKR